jgi:hypothetical protein
VGVGSLWWVLVSWNVVRCRSASLLFRLPLPPLPTSPLLSYLCITFFLTHPTTLKQNPVFCEAPLAHCVQWVCAPVPIVHRLCNVTAAGHTCVRACICVRAGMCSHE